MTRRNQLLTLLRQAAVGSVPITLPAEVNTQWLAVVSAYKAATDAKRRAWHTVTLTDGKAGVAAIPGLPAALKAQAEAAFDAASADTEVAV